MAKLLGVSKVRRQLKQARKRHASRVRPSLIRGGLLLQRFSQQIVPVEFGILKNTANTRAEGDGFDTEVIVSYGTDYAVHVHENPNARHKPPTRYKYLEEPARTRRDEISDEVVRGMEG